MNNESSIFGSTTRERLLQLFLINCDSSFHLRGLCRATNLSVGSIQREIDNLSSIKLVHKEAKGNRIYFKANKKNPLYPSLKALSQTLKQLQFKGLPGGELIKKGVDDLFLGRATLPSLLAEIGRPELSQLGFVLPEAFIKKPEEELYLLLSKKHGDNAHAQYNSLIRRLVSFQRAAACVN